MTPTDPPSSARRSAALSEARVLVVDDEPGVLDVIQRALRLRGVRVTAVRDADASLADFRPGRFDCILSDLLMPGRSGLDLLTEVRQQDSQVGFVLMTGAGQVAHARRAMRHGCDDFLMKPLALEELFLSVQLALEKRNLRARLHQDRDRFERLAQERNLSLQATLERLDDALASEKAAHRKTIRVLAQAAENSDRDMGKHIDRVASYATLLARHVGIEEGAAHDLGLSATLHDVGKISVSAELLTRKGPLTPSEFVEVQKHTLAGGRILQGIDFLREARDIALAHHERWDGGGYPYGLSGHHIPIAARITALADVWDALTSRRCYKQPWPVERALDYVRRERGGHFDPELADACFTLQEQFEDVRLSLSDFPEVEAGSTLRPLARDSAPELPTPPRQPLQAPVVRDLGTEGQLPLN
ncbi:MAG: response regulator [Planctomycetota bacterium]|nr:response regulator [Planctomycetota bacterium]